MDPDRSPLERARDLRAQQEAIVEELEAALAESERRVTEIRSVLAEIRGELPKPTPVVRRKKPERARRAAPAKPAAVGDLRAEIPALLKKRGQALSAPDIADLLGRSVGSVAATLSFLARKGVLKRVDRGVYEAAA